MILHNPDGGFGLQCYKFLNSVRRSNPATDSIIV